MNLSEAIDTRIRLPESIRQNRHVVNTVSSAHALLSDAVLFAYTAKSFYLDNPQLQETWATSWIQTDNEYPVAAGFFTAAIVGLASQELLNRALGRQIRSASTEPQ